MEIMDKKWIHLPRASRDYEKGLDAFLNKSFETSSVSNKIYCPCTHCLNAYRLVRDDVKYHLFRYGFNIEYKQWVYHGEAEECNDNSEEECYSTSDEEMVERGNDADTYQMMYDLHQGGSTHCASIGDDYEEEPNDNAKTFYKLLEDAEVRLYDGCQAYSKLSFIVEVFQMKCLHGLTNGAVDCMLKLMKKALPNPNQVPDSMYEAQKIIRALGLDYEKIHACVNDCILYRKEFSNLDKCPTCEEPRWITTKAANNDHEDVDSNKKKKIPRKVLRHFPLKPRLQRLFMSLETSTAMQWHSKERVDDGILRHPADCKAWKSFDCKYPSFASDPRNVRLGLATDGFNPFGNLSTSYSTWPVVLIPYNLPPWMCMKQSFFMVSLIIPGPKSPGNDIDVYLSPLIDELNDLWENGALTYDAAKKHNFQMRAALMWTINDFPAYGSISGWSTKGKLACPCCSIETHSYWLKYGQKLCYMNHRRFLPDNHRWRKGKSLFTDGSRYENRSPPIPLSGNDVIDHYAKFDQVIFGKTVKKRRRVEGDMYNWKKKSILFDLPYWREQLLRHNLDVMHVEKNICDNFVGTIMGFEGKTKDSLKTRLDLKHMNIMKTLHPTLSGNTYTLPHARFTLTLDEKRRLCKFLQDVKFPDGYASNISRCVNVKEGKLIGLKSHDCHVLFERLFPLALRGLLHKDICGPIIELSLFFGQLCSTTLDPDILDDLAIKVVETLCKLEKIFPPAFFDVMVHLTVHLAYEAKIGGPVQYRWMYPIERYLRTLKGYVRNKARPEGSMAEGLLSEECMIFCARYLRDVGTKMDRPGRNFDGGGSASTSKLSVFSTIGKHLGLEKYEMPSREELNKAHFYVLENCVEVEPWISKHKLELQQESPINVDRRHKEKFITWFTTKALQAYTNTEDQIPDDLFYLSQYPDMRILVFKTYCTNGFKFRTKESEKFSKTQNSGVVVRGDELTGNVDYYGYITDIVKLVYDGDLNSVVLFKCIWFDVPGHGRNQTRGYKKDEYGIVSVNFQYQRYASEPYVLASQVQQVYYVQDLKDPNWHSVVKTKARNIYDIPEKEVVVDEEDDEPYQLNELVENMPDIRDSSMLLNEIIELHLARSDVHGLEVPIDNNVVGQPVSDDDDFIISDEDVEYVTDEDEFMSNDDDDWE